MQSSIRRRGYESSFDFTKVCTESKCFISLQHQDAWRNSRHWGSVQLNHSLACTLFPVGVVFVFQGLFFYVRVLLNGLSIPTSASWHTTSVLKETSGNSIRLYWITISRLAACEALRRLNLDGRLEITCELFSLIPESSNRLSLSSFKSTFLSMQWGYWLIIRTTILCMVFLKHINATQLSLIPSSRSDHYIVHIINMLNGIQTMVSSL